MMIKKLIGAAIAFTFAVSGFIPAISQFTAAVSQTETKLIALTFDDGPNTTTTNEVLDVLEEYGARASFFLIGTNINEESAISVKRAYDMGCEIDNHSMTHSNMGSMSPEDIKAEIDYVDEKVTEIIGEPTKFFRPPFIDTSQTMYDVIDLPFICGIDCQDYMENVTAKERADYILDGAKDGVIVLLHDAAGNSQTVEALKIAMPELIEQGYEFVTLTELFERQGETPKGNMIYTEVAKYPCRDYTRYSNIFTGNASGNSSWSGWSDTAVLDGALLKELGSSYAIEVEYDCPDYPVIALQKWSGTAIWQTVAPFYYNGEKACFLAEDIISALDSLGVDYTDLDRMTITPSAGTMTMTKADILVKDGSPSEMLMGDVNGDDVFSVADVIMLQKWLLTVPDTHLSNWKAADFYEDDKLDVFDLCLMKMALIYNAQSTTPENMPAIVDDHSTITSEMKSLLWSTVKREYPNVDFSDFAFVYEPEHPLKTYIKGNIFSIYYKGVLLHGYANLNTYSNVYATIDHVNFLVDPTLIMQIDTEAPCLSPEQAIPADKYDHIEKTEKIMYIDGYHSTVKLAYRAVSIDCEYIYDAFTGELIELIPYYVV